MPATRLAVLGDAAVLDVDPCPELVGEAEAIGVAQRVEGVDVVGRRVVVMGDAHLERHLGHSLDGL